jgi:hypothetical protein
VPLELQIISIVFGTLGGVGVFSLILWFKLKKKELEMRGSDPELGPVVDALRDDLADMQEHTQAQLAEMQERLDFAERLLTAGRASQEDEKVK